MGPVYPLSDYAPLLTAFILPVWALVFYFSGFYGRRSARTLHTEISRLFRALIVCGLSLAVAVVVSASLSSAGRCSACSCCSTRSASSSAAAWCGR